MKYELAYNEFRKPASVTIAGLGKPLVEYTYRKNSGKLKQVTYANGETANVTYNSLGQVVSESVKDANGSVIARQKYDYDLQGNLVRTIDYLNRKEYTYTYSEETVVRTAENDIAADGNDTILSRTRQNAVSYEYDPIVNKGSLRRKHINTPSGNQEYNYIWSRQQEKKRTVHQKLVCGTKTYESSITADDLGRIKSDNIILERGNLQRVFTYAAGRRTQEHSDNNIIKANASTNLVNRIEYTKGKAITYEYDQEERITKVTDYSRNVTEYGYDAKGQLTAAGSGRARR